MAARIKYQEDIKPERIRPLDWCLRTGMSRNETYRRLYSGDLRAVKVGKMWFINASELQDFFERYDEVA